MLGTTDTHGQLTTTALNVAAVKYTLKACQNGKCSDLINYQVISSEYPFPAFISMGEDPSRSMSFTWHTDQRIKVTVAECVKTDDKAGFKSQQVIRSKGVAYLHELVDLGTPEGKRYKVTIHKSTVRELSPDTRYNYRIGDGKYWREGSFLTAPEQGGKEAVKFLFIADSQESDREELPINFQISTEQGFWKQSGYSFHCSCR